MTRLVITGRTWTHCTCSCSSWWCRVSLVPVGKCPWCDCHWNCLDPGEGRSSRRRWVSPRDNLQGRGFCYPRQWDNIMQRGRSCLWFCWKRHFSGNVHTVLIIWHSTKTANYSLIMVSRKCKVLNIGHNVTYWLLGIGILYRRYQYFLYTARYWPIYGHVTNTITAI